MAWAGSGQFKFLAPDSVQITLDGFDADNEESYTLFPINLEKLGFQPLHARMICTDAQAGLTYDIALQGSEDGTNWVDLITATAKNTHYSTVVDYTSATGNPTPAGYTYYRVFAADVTDGAATSHTVVVHLYR